jgi:Ca2+-binding RTX toxin-like protein
VPPAEVPVPAEEVVEYATELIGTADDDVINGTMENDFFNGMEGDDVLNGGPGADTFHFSAAFGQDVVIGFTAGAAGDDVLEFAGVLSSFDEVMAASLQVGPNVLIEVDDENGIALVNVALSSLNRDDFRFV